MKIMFSLIVVLSIIALSSIIILGMYSIQFQRSLIFLNWAQPYSWLQGIPNKSDFHDTINITTSDRCQIPVWRWGNKTLSGNENIAVIYLHGNAETRAFPKRRSQYENIRKLFKSVSGFSQVTLFVPEYRGFGDSANVQPSETGLLNDALAVYNHVENDTRYKYIYIWGQSLGSGVAALTARYLYEHKKHINQVILEAPFRSILHAALDHWVGYPLRLIPKFLRDAIFNRIVDRFETEKHVKVISQHVPVLFIHGKEDWVISHEQSVYMYNEVMNTKPSGKADFVSFPNTGHSYCTFHENFLKIQKHIVLD